MSLTPIIGHVFAITGAIKGVDPKESIASVESAMRRLVVKLFPKNRFKRAESFIIRNLNLNLLKVEVYLRVGNRAYQNR
jgi:hypothetical protein